MKSAIGTGLGRATAIAAVALLALMLLPGWVGRAAADSSDGHIASYDVTLTPKADGTLGVREVIAYDFENTQHHGIYRIMSLRSTWPHDTDYERVWKVDDVKVTQDGSKAKVEKSNENGNFGLRIGDEDENVTGLHTYDIRYRVKGAFIVEDGRIEMNWNAIGTFWEVSMDKVTVTLDSAGVQPESIACSTGSTGSTDSCGTGATATVTSVQPGQGISVEYLYPVGAIADAEPILQHKITASWAFAGRPWAPAVGVVIAGVLSFLSVRHWRRNGRDDVYVDQIPGLRPTEGQAGAVVTGAPAPETSVQFSPPEGVRPAELEYLTRASTSNRSTTATIIDLANRGAYHVVQGTQSKAKGWRIVFDGHRPDDMTRWESSLLDGLLSKSSSGELEMGKSGELSSVASSLQAGVKESVQKRGWFKKAPEKARAGQVALGSVVLVPSLFFLVAGARYGLSAIGVFGVLAAIVMMVVASKMPARTADGSAMLAESNAFRRFVETADLQKIKQEERLAVFNRFLPYAIVYDLTETWVKTFEPVLREAQDRGVAMPVVFLSGYNASFDSAFSSFTSSMGSSMSSSSGGTGGGVGGGGGGGGGGAW